MTFEEAYQQIRKMHYEILNERESISKSARLSLILWVLDILAECREPQDEFDGMIFSTDKYMAFIDKKEIHIMRKSAHKITVERMFDTEEDEE